MIHNNYQSVPNYSWSVQVIAHEFGHLFGSRHTHACVWNGNNTAIDGCDPNGTEGGCPVPGIPSGGGTIMSYCHLQAVGINFILGFRPQPGNVIRNSVAGILCTNSIDNYFEILTDPYLTGATYEVQILAIPSPVVYSTTTTFPITPLPAYSGPTRQYQIRVRVINNPCASGDWTYSFFEYVDCGYSPWKVFPNPADEILTVSFDIGRAANDSIPKRNSLSSFSVILYDSGGREHQKAESRNGEDIHLDTNDLPEGTYFVHIHKDNEVEKRQVVIRH